MSRSLVVIPTYNNEKYISEAVESVLSQTFRDYEILVIDDGSTDGTRRLLEPYMDRIRYHFQENQGLAVARNVGLDLAEGEFVNYLDGDDIMLDGNLEIKAAIMGANPAIGGVFSNFCVFNDIAVLHERGEKETFQFFRRTGKEIPEIFPSAEEIRFHGGRNTTLYSGMIFDWLFQGNVVLPSTMLFRKRFALQVGKFLPHLRTQQDYEYWLRFSKLHPLAYIDDVLVKYRRHSRQLTDRSNIARVIETSLRIIEAYEEEFDSRGQGKVFRIRKVEKLKELSKAFIRMDRAKQARDALAESIRLDPGQAACYAYYLLTFVPGSVIRYIYDRVKSP